MFLSFGLTLQQKIHSETKQVGQSRGSVAILSDVEKTQTFKNSWNVYICLWNMCHTLLYQTTFAY